MENGRKKHKIKTLYQIFWRMLQRVNVFYLIVDAENISVSLLLNQILWLNSSFISMCAHALNAADQMT